MKVYFLKISLRGVSPMIWRRLRVPGITSLARLHDCIQIVNGWDDEHLNQFRIFGKNYGVYHDGGISFNDNADAVYIDDFKFDVGDKFSYEYNFFKHIMHDIRVEDIKDALNRDIMLSCIGGSGMPGATKSDVADLQFKMLQKIVDKKGKLTIQDIHEHQNQLRQIKFSRKYGVVQKTAVLGLQLT